MSTSKRTIDTLADEENLKKVKFNKNNLNENKATVNVCPVFQRFLNLNDWYCSQQANNVQINHQKNLKSNKLFFF